MRSYRILGPVEASAEGEVLPIGGPIQLRLFAVLVLNANRAVSSDALIDAVWGSERSAADNRLQMAIARLRRALEPLGRNGEPPLRTVGGGYMLTIAPGELDADVFGAGVEEGRNALHAGDAARAAELLRSALALWRGPPLAEVSFEDFAQAEIRLLEETRLGALVTRIQADLQLGRHSDLIGELQSLHVEYPIHEPFTELLMLALYRCGRQAEALDAYQRTRVQLAEQLGLEPGDGLKSLHADILAQAPWLNRGAGERPAGETRPTEHLVPRVPRPVSASLPGRVQPYGPSVFVDRRKEHAALVGALEDVRSSGRRTVFVTGEPGIGKTRLVSEFAAEAHAGGTLVLAGRCDEGTALPYQPFVEALEHLVDGAPLELLQAHVAHYGDSLARLVPDLAVRVTETPAVMPQASESERYVLFRAIEGLLTDASASGPILLVLEDLHWADVPTLELLSRLLSSPRRAPLLLLCTCRLKELSEDHPVRDLLADVHRERGTLRIDLEGLAVGDVDELVRGLTQDEVGATDDRLVTALETTTDGNPFFITELVRNLVETGALANEDGRWQLSPDVEPDDHLPLSISETFAKRLRRMGEAVQRCLHVAAVVGEEFDLDLVSAIADGGSPADALDEAVGGAVLVEVPGSSVRLRFAHALMQRYLYGELSRARRTELHRRVALALEARLDQGRVPIAELARHWCAAGDADTGKALQYALLAGDEALGKLAPDDARRWYQISLDLVRRQPAPRKSEVCDLLIRRGEAERQAGDRRFRQTLLEAAGLAQEIGDDRALVRAALANTRGMQSETGVIDDERIESFDAALTVLGDQDSPERAQLLAMQAAELMYSPDWDRKTRLSDEALAIGRRLGDPEALSRVLNMRFVTLLAPDTHGERSANAVEAVAAAEQLSNPLERFFAYHWAGYACVEAGDTERARSWMAREREIAEQFRQPITLWLSRADEANMAIVAGELELAGQHAAAALEVGRHSEPDAIACFAAQQTAIAFEAGRLGELVPLLEQAVAENPGVPGFRATLALALVDGPRAGEARSILDQAAARNFAELPYDVTWLAVVCIYSYISASVGDTPSAETLYGLLEPWATQVAFPAFGVWGPVSLYLGSLALVLGDFDHAERQLFLALRAATDARAPLWQARVTDQLRRLDETSE
jgi:DNA-binding SARP family transcriptional activator